MYPGLSNSRPGGLCWPRLASLPLPQRGQGRTLQSMPALPSGSCLSGWTTCFIGVHILPSILQGEQAGRAQHRNVERCFHSASPLLLHWCSQIRTRWSRPRCPVCVHRVPEPGLEVWRGEGGVHRCDKEWGQESSSYFCWPNHSSSNHLLLFRAMDPPPPPPAPQVSILALVSCPEGFC